MELYQPVEKEGDKRDEDFERASGLSDEVEDRFGAFFDLGVLLTQPEIYLSILPARFTCPIIIIKRL